MKLLQSNTGPPPPPPMENTLKAEMFLDGFLHLEQGRGQGGVRHTDHGTT